LARLWDLTSARPETSEQSEHDFLSFFSHINETPTLHSYNFLMQLYCVRLLDLKLGKSLLHLMWDQNLKPNGLTFTYLLKGFAETGNHQEFVKTWEQSRGLYTRKTFKSALAGCAKFGDLKLAQNIVKQMTKKYKLGQFEYLQMIKCADIFGDIETAESMYDQQFSRMDVDEHSALYLIQAYFRRGMISDAERIFERQFIFTPSKELIQALYAGYNILGKTENAEQVFKKYADLFQLSSPDDLLPILKMCEEVDTSWCYIDDVRRDFESGNATRLLEFLEISSTHLTSSAVVCLQEKWSRHDSQPYVYTSIRPNQDTLDIFSQTSSKTRKIVILRYSDLIYRFYKGRIGLESKAIRGQNHDIK